GRQPSILRRQRLQLCRRNQVDDDSRFIPEVMHRFGERRLSACGVHGANLKAGGLAAKVEGQDIESQLTSGSLAHLGCDAAIIEAIQAQSKLLSRQAVVEYDAAFQTALLGRLAGDGRREIDDLQRLRIANDLR